MNSNISQQNCKGHHLYYFDNKHFIYWFLDVYKLVSYFRFLKIVLNIMFKKNLFLNFMYIMGWKKLKKLFVLIILISKCIKIKVLFYLKIKSLSKY